MKITVELPISLHVGILHYNNLESGFWQLKEDGIDYNLINLPENFQMEGVKVAVLLKKILDEVNIFMTGDFYEILNIKFVE